MSAVRPDDAWAGARPRPRSTRVAARPATARRTYDETRFMTVLPQVTATPRVRGPGPTTTAPEVVRALSRRHERIYRTSRDVKGRMARQGVNIP
ncbi:hypothetical protein CCE01nite_15730 [Cellulomonas cellasea]|uniref:Uncharacterized protein n=1 Tax=Cellulomonas cellasea TaxID=43670 RepID=A0A4Y3KW07_9CELL|nr:hypothetical protein CCE01nite_15730 [Cellulomonas cellasea]